FHGFEAQLATPLPFYRQTVQYFLIRRLELQTVESRRRHARALESSSRLNGACQFDILDPVRHIG
ncbi:hypothetical protein, partial [Mesorhizobium sp. M7A.F.Ca.ET.027.03.2.1]|uniref:hypothetical protein n=1 Tax=Mesorhizobium sp. M7A.F.Ca.ET.027.03.2.1 TaxID=2496656 RepID=UPI001AEC9DCB